MNTPDEVAPDDATAEGVPAEIPHDAGLPKDRPHGVTRKIVSGVLSYGIVVLALWYLFSELHSTSESGAALALITGWQLVVVVVLGVVNLATNWPPIVIALPGLRVREAAVTNTASAALSNTVPEGGAIATGLNFAMLRSWGFSLPDITSEVVVTGTWSQMTKYILLAISLTRRGVAGDGSSGHRLGRAHPDRARRRRCRDPRSDLAKPEFRGEVGRLVTAGRCGGSST